MAKNRGKKKGRGKQPRGPGGARSHPASWSAADERAHYAALGCHVADVCRGRHRARSAPLGETHRRAMREHPWLLGIEDFDPSEYRAEDVTRIPEVAMDDGDGGDGPMTLTLTNVAGDATNACFVTVYDVDLCGADGTVLTSGATSVVVASGDADGGTDATITKERKCTTFIVLCPPRTFVHLCSLAPDQRRASAGREEPVASWRQVEIETDVQPWSSHPDVDDEHPYLLHFPFRGTGEASKGGDRAYRCTQAEHGQLTHCEIAGMHSPSRTARGTNLHSVALRSKSSLPWESPRRRLRVSRWDAVVFPGGRHRGGRPRQRFEGERRCHRGQRRRGEEPVPLELPHDSRGRNA